MGNACKIDRWAARHSLMYTCLAMLAAHAYRYLTLGYTDDSVQIVQSTDRTWQIALGRFLQPVYWRLRGDIVAPYLIGVLSCLWLSAAVYLIVRMMGMRSRVSIALTCALLAGNATLTFSNATFISWSDVYMLSLLLATASVAVWQRGRGGVLLSPFLICASLALYQSYFQVAVLLYLMVLCRRTMDGEPLGGLIRSGFAALAALIAGLLLYSGALRVVEGLTGIGRTTTYNGIGNIGGYALADVPRLLGETWLYPFRYFLSPETHNPRVTSALYPGLFAVAVLALVALIRARGLPVGHAALALALTLLMPLGMNAVYFISKGVVHSLTIYSFFVFFAYPIWLLEKISRGGYDPI